MRRRAISFLPSATEIVFALGLEGCLVGVTDKCLYPREARKKPIVVSSVIKTEGMKGAEIDEAIRRHITQGFSLYRVDVKKLQALRPEIIFAQELCDVCSAANHEVQIAKEVVPDARIVWLTPRNLADVLENILQVAEALGAPERGKALRETLRERLKTIATKTAPLPLRPRVWVAEWIDPPFCSGHWVPEMVELAGGKEVLGQKGKPSHRLRWEEVVAAKPEVLVLAPCGYRIEDTLKDIPTLMAHPGWPDLPAVRSGRVYVVDGDFFACPGPRLVEGVALLAHLLHPSLFPTPPPSVPFLHWTG